VSNIYWKNRENIIVVNFDDCTKEKWSKSFIEKFWGHPCGFHCCKHATGNNDEELSMDELIDESGEEDNGLEIFSQLDNSYTACSSDALLQSLVEENMLDSSEKPSNGSQTMMDENISDNAEGPNILSQLDLNSQSAIFSPQSFTLKECDICKRQLQDMRGHLQRYFNRKQISAENLKKYGFMKCLGAECNKVVSKVRQTCHKHSALKSVSRRQSGMWGNFSQESSNMEWPEIEEVIATDVPILKHVPVKARALCGTVMNSTLKDMMYATGTLNIPLPSP